MSNSVVSYETVYEYIKTAINFKDIYVVVLGKILPVTGESGILYLIELSDKHKNVTCKVSVLIDSDKEDDMPHIVCESVIITYLNWFHFVCSPEKYAKKLHRIYVNQYNSLLSILDPSIVYLIVHNMVNFNGRF